jgi:hypothetical protein
MDQQRLVNTLKGEKGRGETQGVVGGLSLGKRGVKRVGSGLNMSSVLEKAWSAIACVQSVLLEMGRVVEEMRVPQSCLVGSRNSFDRGQILMAVGQEGIVIERGMDDTHLIVACHNCYRGLHTQRLSGQYVAGVFGGDESCQICR